MLVWSMPQNLWLFTLAFCFGNCWKEGCPSPFSILYYVGTWLRRCEFNGRVEPLITLRFPTGSAKVESSAQFCLLSILTAYWNQFMPVVVDFIGRIISLGLYVMLLTQPFLLHPQMPSERSLPFVKNLLRLMEFALMPVRLSLYFSDTLHPLFCPLFTMWSEPPFGWFSWSSWKYSTVRSVWQTGHSIKIDDIHTPANSVLFQFNGCDPATKMKLFKAYCFSLYGCALCNVWSINNVIRWFWKLPYNCHTFIAHSIGLTTNIYNIIYSRFIRLLSTAIVHPSRFIRSVFHDVQLSSM